MAHLSVCCCGECLTYQPGLCLFPIDCCLLSLVTVGVLRKYISFLELPLSCLLSSSLCCCVGLQGYRRAKVSLAKDMSRAIRRHVFRAHCNTGQGPYMCGQGKS